MSGGPNRVQRRAWPKRRQWLDRIAGDSRLTSGAKAWLMLLARRSDDNGKPVWGNQKKMAAQIGRCDRSVRRYRLEAETLGYVDCYRSKPLRDPRTGRWSRVRSNSYYLRLPAAQRAAEPAPRRRQRAPYCVVSSGRRRFSDRADSEGRSSPVGVRQPTHHPPRDNENETVTQPTNTAPPDIARFWLAEMRATVGKHRTSRADARH